MAIVNTPRQLVFDAARDQYRKEYEAAQRAANRAEGAEQYDRAIARLHRANDKLNKAQAVFEAEGGKVVI